MPHIFQNGSESGYYPKYVLIKDKKIRDKD